ncbi:MAG: hypothetical protein WD928_04010 [Gammaproteobacteria bacterium]
MPCSQLKRLLPALLVLPLAIAVAEEKVLGEQLLFAEPEGWEEVYADREGQLSTTEYVPAGQNATNWQEMLSIQILLGKPDADPDAMLSQAALHLEKSCPDFELQPIELGGVGDYPTLAVMVMCGQNTQSGHGEFTLLRGISGKENFYLLQKIWRGPAYQAETGPPVSLDERKFWLGFLAFLTVCDPALGNCPENLE